MSPAAGQSDDETGGGGLELQEIDRVQAAQMVNNLEVKFHINVISYIYLKSINLSFVQIEYSLLLQFDCILLSSDFNELSTILMYRQVLRL